MNEYKFQYSQSDGKGGILVARTDNIEEVKVLKTFVDELMGKGGMEKATQSPTATQAPILGAEPIGVSPQNPRGKNWCALHQISMKQRVGKDEKVFYSHAKLVEGTWIYCSGQGFPMDLKKAVEESGGY